MALLQQTGVLILRAHVAGALVEPFSFVPQGICGIGQNLKEEPCHFLEKQVLESKEEGTATCLTLCIALDAFYVRPPGLLSNILLSIFSDGAAPTSHL